MSDQINFQGKPHILFEGGVYLVFRSRQAARYGLPVVMDVSPLQAYVRYLQYEYREATPPGYVRDSGWLGQHPALGRQAK